MRHDEDLTKDEVKAAIDGGYEGGEYLDSIGIFDLRQLSQDQWATFCGLIYRGTCTALRKQAARTEGAAGTDLLAEAVTAYRAALEVYTRADHPVAWAMTQENLGLAFEAMAGRATGDPGARYAKALACFDGALEVFDLERMAPSHAKCRRNRDRVAAKLAALGPPEGSLGPKPE